MTMQWLSDRAARSLTHFRGRLGVPSGDAPLAEVALNDADVRLQVALAELDQLLPLRDVPFELLELVLAKLNFDEHARFAETQVRLRLRQLRRARGQALFGLGHLRLVRADARLP